MHSELRVHGVSGTPPKDMLYTDPITYDRSGGATKVYEVNRDTWNVRGFHWGSLTAGSSITAFWILLAPFAMANASGWMTDRANTWTRAFGRVAGLGLTGILFAQFSGMALDTPFIAKHETWTNPNTWMLVLFVGTIVALVLGLAYLSTQSTFRRISILQRTLLVFSPLPKHMTPTRYWDSPIPSEQWDDPAAGAQLTGDSMWERQAVLHRIRRIHLSGGLLVICLASSMGIGHDALTVTGVVFIGLIVFLILLTTWIPSNPGIKWATALLPIASVGLAIATALNITSATLTSGDFDSSAKVVFGSALLFGAGAALALFGEWVKAFATRRWTFYRAGWISLGILAVAALIGASLGLTGTLLLEDLLAPDANSVVIQQGGGWTAVAMLGLVVVMAATSLVLAMRPLRGTRTYPGQDPPPAKEAALRRLVLRGRVLLGIAGLYGIGAGIVAVLRACPGLSNCDPRNLASVPQEPTALLIELFGFSFDLGTPVGIAKLLVVVVPAVLIIRSVLGGLLSGEESRRKVGILWDLGSFWPRWFHPLGPPAYSPYAVKRLEEELLASRPEVLGAHSQGSLISAVALQRVSPSGLPTAFLTYGSQLGILYRDLFPSVGFDQLADQVKTRLDGRWINLWRRSDPIGGQLIPELNHANWHLLTGSGHSQYELTPEYCAARKGGLSNNLDLPPYSDIEGCWDAP